MAGREGVEPADGGLGRPGASTCDLRVLTCCGASHADDRQCSRDAAMASRWRSRSICTRKPCFRPKKACPGIPSCRRLKDSVDTFTPLLPCVVNLRNNNLQERHWDEIHALLGFEIKGDKNFTLGDLVNEGVTAHADQITVIATNATQESVLEEMMAKVRFPSSGPNLSLWKAGLIGEALRTDRRVDDRLRPRRSPRPGKVPSIVMPYKDVKDLYILGDVSELIAALDESLVTVNTVLGSRYVGGIRDSWKGWRKNLILFQDTALDEWLACQQMAGARRGWRRSTRSCRDMDVSRQFASADIIRQLPAAAKKFQSVDKSWKATMKATADDPLALKSCTVAGRKEMFLQHNATLDKIQKSLDEYIETKCSAFPRFYFLSADELLEILSQSKNPQAVQPHMRKCFDNLVRLDFGDDPSSVDIQAMFSGRRGTRRSRQEFESPRERGGLAVVGGSAHEAVAARAHEGRVAGLREFGARRVGRRWDGGPGAISAF